MPKQTYLFTAVYLCGFQLLLLCGVLVALVRVLTPYFSWYLVSYLLHSTCKTKCSTENPCHLSRNNRWRMICKRSTFCTRWLWQNSKWSLFPITIWKLASLRQIVGESTSKFFILQLFLSWISGSISVSGQLPTYPSPNPTLTLTCNQLTVIRLGEG